MNAPTLLRLEGALTIVGAHQHHALLTGLLDGAPHEVALELSAVDAIDSAGLQLLLALRRSLEARGAALRLDAAPPVVLEAIATCGLQGLLAPATAPATAPTETP